MKRLLLSLILVMTASTLGMAQQTPPAQGDPPTSLVERDGHWTANGAPPDDTTAYEVHTVAAGDTLWAIARTYLDDPFLWPQLWEANAHIVNPHWIYPEDIVLIRPVTAISDVVPPPPPAVPEPEPQAPRTVHIPTLSRPTDYDQPVLSLFEPPEQVAAPPVKASDLYCSGFITTRRLGEETPSVIALTPPDEGLVVSRGRYVYVSRGAQDGAQVGDVLSVIRPTRDIESTRDGVGELGQHYLDLGQLRTVMVQPEFSLARVEGACAEIALDDLVTEFQEIDFPELPPNRPFSPFMAPSGKTSGAVAMTLDILRNSRTPSLGGSGVIAGYRKGLLEEGPLPGVVGGLAGEGRIVYLDLGAQDGIQTGDLFTVYRPLDAGQNRIRTISSEGRDLLGGQRYSIGELVVLKVEERAATALITFSSDGISPGDLVELR